MGHSCTLPLRSSWQGGSLGLTGGCLRLPTGPVPVRQVSHDGGCVVAKQARDMAAGSPPAAAQGRARGKPLQSVATSSRAVTAPAREDIVVVAGWQDVTEEEPAVGAPLGRNSSSADVTATQMEGDEHHDSPLLKALLDRLTDHWPPINGAPVQVKSRLVNPPVPAGTRGLEDGVKGLTRDGARGQSSAVRAVEGSSSGDDDWECLRGRWGGSGRGGGWVLRKVTKGGATASLGDVAGGTLGRQWGRALAEMNDDDSDYESDEESEFEDPRRRAGVRAGRQVRGGQQRKGVSLPAIKALRAWLGARLGRSEAGPRVPELRRGGASPALSFRSGEESSDDDSDSDDEEYGGLYGGHFYLSGGGANSKTPQARAVSEPAVSPPARKRLRVVDHKGRLVYPRPELEAGACSQHSAQRVAATSGGASGVSSH